MYFFCVPGRAGGSINVLCLLVNILIRLREKSIPVQNKCSGFLYLSGEIAELPFKNVDNNCDELHISPSPSFVT